MQVKLLQVLECLILEVVVLLILKVQEMAVQDLLALDTNSKHNTTTNIK